MQKIFNFILKLLEGFFNSMQVNSTNLIPTEFSPDDPILIMKNIYRNFGADWGEVNIMGVRNESDPGEWNDFFLVNIGDFLGKYEGTTDPGVYYTKKPLKSDGAFHLCYGFHKNLWGIGFHRGYQALVQKGKCKGWRDKNKNFKNDDNIYVIKKSAINFHHGYSTPGDISKHGAGCQVIRNKESYEKLLTQIKKTGIKRISYLLISINDCPYELKA